MSQLAAGEPVQARAPLVTASTFWLVVSLAVIALFSLAQESLPIIAAYVTFGAIGLACASLLDAAARRLFMVVYGSAAVAAVGLYLYYERLYGVPYFLGGSDELHYEDIGRVFALTFGLFDYADIRGNLVVIWHNSVAYLYIVGVLFKFALVFGEPHTMVPRLFNAACLGLVAVGVYRLGVRLALRRNAAVVCGLFAGCLPLMMFVSVQTLRDIMVTLLLVQLVVVWTPREGQRQSILTAAAWTLLIAVALIDLRRAHAFVAVIIAGMGFLSTDLGRRPLVRVFAFAAAGLIGAVLYVLLGDVVSGDVLFFLWQIDYYNDYRVDETGGGLSSVVFTTPPPLGWLLRIAYALASPLPERSIELDKLWLNAGTITQIMFIPFFFSGMRIASHRRNWWTVLGAMVLLFIGMAMFTFQGRHIAQYLPFAILLAALGYERHRANRAVIFAAMAAVGAAFAVVYVMLKM